MKTLRDKIHYLYESNGRMAVIYRRSLFLFDIFLLFYIVVSSFFYGHYAIEILDFIFGIVILWDFIARLSISRSVFAFFRNPWIIADIIVIFSLMLPLIGENFAFLRVVRILRLLHSHNITSYLGNDWRYFRRNKDVIKSSLNLLIFIFVMTAIVFETQIGTNEQIKNYFDALYFTVTTLTTTGFGDITMQGSFGRFIAVIIMIFGVSLFINLIRAIFRPYKVTYSCDRCGLYLHDRDAVHCKHCGNILAIPDEGLD